MVGRTGLSFCMREAENPISNICFLHYFARSPVSALEGPEIAENIDIVRPAYTSFGHGQNFVQKDWVNGLSFHGPDEERIGSTIF